MGTLIGETVGRTQAPITPHATSCLENKMAKEYYLQSLKVEGLRFKIVELDREKMRAKLQGATGVPFEQSISADSLKKFGYKVEVKDATPVSSE